MPKPPNNFEKAPAYLELQPLRIPAGWRIGWNTLHTTSRVDQGDFGGSSVFLATNEGRRFRIDVMFRPEHDPSGHFVLEIEYQPWPRTERGKRRDDLPFRFDTDSEIVHSFETRSYAELVEELETWIARCSIWEREGH